MKAYTDLEQSKVLSKILPLDTADGGWYGTNDPFLPNTTFGLYTKYSNKASFPAWSLTALFSVLPVGTKLLKSVNISSIGDIKYHCDCPKGNVDGWYDDPIDACYEMILNLKKNNSLVMKDKNGNILKIGDIVHNCYGYDLIVCQNINGEYYGKLVCEKGHSCEDLPYALYSSEIELLHK